MRATPRGANGGVEDKPMEDMPGNGGNYVFVCHFVFPFSFGKDF